MAAVPVEALDAAQLEQVREAAFEAARKAGLRTSRAELIADATVGALVHARHGDRS